MKIYEEEFKKNTRFNINNQNLYVKFINEDNSLKTMLMLDILSDFCDQKGLTLKYLGQFYKIISQFFTADAKKNSKGDRSTLTFSKMISILIGYEDVWVQLFKVCQTLSECDYELKIGRVEGVASRDNLRKYIVNLFN